MDVKDAKLREDLKLIRNQKNVKFSTWLGNQMRYHCLNCLNKKGPLLAMENDAIKNIVEQNQKKNNYSESLIKEKSDFIFSLLERTKDERILKIFKF